MVEYIPGQNGPRRKLSKQAIEEYKKIYKAEFGCDLNNAEAEEEGLRLLRLFRLKKKI